MLALGANGRGRAGLLSALRPQDVFATSLYTGTGASQTVTSGIDLLGQGGLLWRKGRSVTSDHVLSDTARTADKQLSTNTTGAEVSGSGVAFTSTGFTNTAGSGVTLAAWSFRRAPKFFDIVTYTGDGTSGRVIPHALGIKPGMIIVKQRDAVTNWPVWHASLGVNNYMRLNGTDANLSSSNYVRTADDTSFTVGPNNAVNLAGGLYVAHLIAHDPDTTNGIVQCGIGPTTLPWAPQWIIGKNSAGTQNWFVNDSARGFAPPAGTAPTLFPNLSNAESSQAAVTVDGSSIAFNGANQTVWCAIRAPIT